MEKEVTQSIYSPIWEVRHILERVCYRYYFSDDINDKSPSIDDINLAIETLQRAKEKLEKYYAVNP